MTEFDYISWEDAYRKCGVPISFDMPDESEQIYEPTPAPVAVTLRGNLEMSEAKQQTTLD